MKHYRNPLDVHQPIAAAYTHQIEIRGPERLLALSGQVGQRKDGFIPDDPIEQLETAFANVIHNLEAAGMDVQDLFKITFYLVGDIDARRRREVTASRLNGHQPCMTVLYVAALANPVYKVEIDAWASKAE